LIALDTSILARLLLRDNPAEERAAAEFIERNSCLVGWTVLIELCWVLERSARLPLDQVVSGLAMLAEIDTITLPDEAAFAWALARYAEGADFPDMVHIATAVGQADQFATFDRKMARQAGTDAPVSILTLKA